MNTLYISHDYCIGYHYIGDIYDVNTIHMINFRSKYNSRWEDICSYINYLIKLDGRDQEMFVDIQNNKIYILDGYDANIIYVLDTIDNYTHILREYCTIKSIGNTPKYITTMLYKWIGKKSHNIGNIRLLYYITMYIFLFMMIATCFFLLFVLVLT